MDAPPAWPAEPVFTGYEGNITLPELRLHYWDTRVDGPTVLLLHPQTGGGEIWAHQHAEFAAHGLRTISYSRRGHHRSEPGPPERPGTAAADLDALVSALGLDRFHLLGSAMGGAHALDYALTYPARVRTLTLACSLAGVGEPGFTACTRALLPAGWSSLPEDFREVGPSYRAGNPAGLARWNEFVGHSAGAAPQPMTRPVSYQAIKALPTPTLLLGGAADLYLPPSRLRELASHFNRHELVILPEVGHAAFWEAPVAFNAAVLEFIRRHPD